MLFLNLKNYPQAVGPANVTKYVTAVRNVIEQLPESQKKIVLLPSQIDLTFALSTNTTIRFGAQHVDSVGLGSTTGWTPAEALTSNGINYAIINHSEHRVYNDEFVQNIIKIQESGLKLVVCCENLEEVEVILEAQPYAIALEDKDLIGSGKSITETSPDQIVKFVDLIGGRCLPIVGAGVSTGADVQAALDLGAKGCILASAFVKAPNLTEKLTELVKPLI